MENSSEWHNQIQLFSKNERCEKCQVHVPLCQKKKKEVKCTYFYDNQN